MGGGVAICGKLKCTRLYDSGGCPDNSNSVNVKETSDVAIPSQALWYGRNDRLGDKLSRN